MLKGSIHFWSIKWYQSGHTLIRFNLYCVIHWPLFVMDWWQSLIIPHLFHGTNYAYWKVHMRAFLQSLDEKVWQAVETSWTRPKEAPANWDDAKIKAVRPRCIWNKRSLHADCSHDNRGQWITKQRLTPIRVCLLRYHLIGQECIDPLW